MPIVVFNNVRRYCLLTKHYTKRDNKLSLMASNNEINKKRRQSDEDKL